VKKYRFDRWEDGSVNPSRIINLKTNMQIIAYYKEVTDMRKGAPSQSDIVTVMVHPKEAESTVLTLTSDKTEYTSGDSIVLNGKLKFQSDGVGLLDRIVDIYKNDVKIGSATTIAEGGFTYTDTAEEVGQDTQFNYLAKFVGD